MSHSQKCTFWIVATAVAMFTGCTSMQPLESTRPEAVSSSVEAGDEIEVRTTTNRLIRMEVDEVSATGLRGDEQFVAYADMSSISVRAFDRAKTGRTILITGGAILAAGLMYYALQGYAAASILDSAPAQ